MDEHSLNAVGGHCPVCGQEYRPGFRVCADEGATLEPGPAPDAAPEEPAGASRADVRFDFDAEADRFGPEPAVLGAWKVDEAMLLAGHLRSIGIPAVAERDTGPDPMVAIHGGAPAGVAELLHGGRVRVFVRPEDVDRAREETERIQQGGEA